MSKDLKDEVINFISEYIPIEKTNLNDNITLSGDLGLDGDDAVEFMKAFMSRFSVDLSGFEYDKYFGPESGFNPIIYLFRLISGRGKKLQIAVRDLIVAAETNKWPSR